MLPILSDVEQALELGDIVARPVDAEVQPMVRPLSNRIEGGAQVDEIILDLVGKLLNRGMLVVLNVHLLRVGRALLLRPEGLAQLGASRAPAAHHRVQLLAAKLDLCARVSNDVVVAKRDEAHGSHRVDAVDDPADLTPVRLTFAQQQVADRLGEGYALGIFEGLGKWPAGTSVSELLASSSHS